jgi:hypothetical protein
MVYNYLRGKSLAAILPDSEWGLTPWTFEAAGWQSR